MKSTIHSTNSASKALTQQAGQWRHILVMLILLSALGILTGYLLCHDNAETRTSIQRHMSSTRPDRSTRVRSKIETIHEWQWPTDGQCTYQVNQSLDLAPGNGSVAPEVCGLTKIDGKLNVCFVDADAQGVTLGMQLSEITVTIDPAGEKAPDRQPVIENMLNTSPGLLRLNRHGRILSCELPAALADEDRTMLQGLFATEIVLGTGSSWETDEMMQGLAFRSFYRTETGACISKTRRAMEAQKGQPSVRILSSEFTLVPGPFWIESLDGSEKMEYIWQNRIICLASTSLKIKRLVETKIPERLFALMRDPAARENLIDSMSLMSNEESTKESARERQHHARLVQRYQTVPAAQMIHDLLNAVTNAKDHAATVPAMHALRDWLLANPSRSYEIAEALKNPDLQGEVSARVAHALELAGKTSKESQTALASIIAAPPGSFQPSVLMQAIVAAGGVGRLQSPELLHALSEMAAAENPSEDYQLSNASLFAMGTLARDNPDLQPKLVETVSPWLTADGKASFEDTSTALRTLENAHNEDPVVIEKALLILLNHEEPDVRAAAIGFLSTTGKPNAVQAIEKARANDQSDIVRHEATAVLTRKD